MECKVIVLLYSNVMPTALTAPSHLCVYNINKPNSHVRYKNLFLYIQQYIHHVHHVHHVHVCVHTFAKLTYFCMDPITTVTMSTVHVCPDV